MPAISVVVPVYNVEEYLAYCLDSIRRQSFADIEIICVNDGSTDSSGEILRRASSLEPRMRVIEKANGGLSSARNAGIDAASGDIVMFVDSDDWLDRDACQTVHQVFQRHHPDISTFAAAVFPASEMTAWMRVTLRPRPAVITDRQADVPFMPGATPFVWRTAVSRSLLDRTGLRFEEGLALGEDQVFLFAAYPLSSKTVLSSDSIYNYRAVRQGSLMADHRDAAETRLSQHQQIVRRVLQAWQSSGLLATKRRQLADWMVEFLFWDVLARGAAVRRAMQPGLASLINDFFADMTGLGGSTKRLFAATVNGGPDMLHCYLPLVHQSLETKGILRGSVFVGRKAVRLPRHLMVSLTRRVAPHLTSQLRRSRQSTADILADATRRAQCTAMLYAETDGPPNEGR